MLFQIKIVKFFTHGHDTMNRITNDNDMENKFSDSI